LTSGRPEVTDVLSFNGSTADEVLALAHSLESRSEHPLARAINDAAKAKGLEAREAVDFQAVPGSGAQARLDGADYFIGSWSFFEDRLLPLTAKPDILHLEEAAKTVVFVGTETELIGAVALADAVRPQASGALAALRSLGMRRLIMLTGDNEPAAAAVAGAVGVDAFHAQLLPEDKVGLIKTLRKRYGRVAMVGDGVNDAPALALANVGIAMGAAGSDVALETADIALMSDDIAKLSEVVDLSRRTMRVVKQNMVFSLGVVGFLIIATFGGYLTLTLGIIGHQGSALAVIFNGMRLLRTTPARGGGRR
jgi:Zn2+/Cd2+-exporting ATPase